MTKIILFLILTLALGLPQACAQDMSDVRRIDSMLHTYNKIKRKWVKLEEDGLYKQLSYNKKTGELLKAAIYNPKTKDKVYYLHFINNKLAFVRFGIHYSRKDNRFGTYYFINNEVVYSDESRIESQDVQVFIAMANRLASLVQE